MTKRFEFIKEAKQLHKLFTKFKVPDSKVPEVSTKRLRLTYKNKAKSVQSKLIYLYGEEKGKATFGKIERKMRVFSKKKPKKLKYKDRNFTPLDRFTQKDVVLITYPDSIFEKDILPLKTLNKFSKKYLKDTINTIHILPFYPYSSDRGFSVSNYKKVNKKFGKWEDVRNLSNDFNMMFDAVFNHVSVKSSWFKKYLRENLLYENHFISFEHKNEISREDMKKITRPRTSDLLTEFKTKEGKKYVWTTFSPDQVDLNFKEPRVLLRLVDVLFRYIRNGATMIRLDAINYVWKELGTSCVHLKQTHVIVQLFRDILDIVAPSVSIVTETNVPHAHNIKYFGNGKNEAQMVYNFALPPLVLYTLYKGNAKYISKWADRLERVSKYCTYFNFLASHDGIGLQPVKRVLPQKEVRFLIRKAKQHGSFVQHKTYGEGKTDPYELNITWWNAINNESEPIDEELKIRKYMASQAIKLSIKGVPGIYLHSLLGTGNDITTYQQTKILRDINRKNLNLQKLKKKLSSDSITNRVFERFMELIKIRIGQKAFHPDAEQKIILQNDAIFSLIRTSMGKNEKVLVLINVTDTDQDYMINKKELGLFDSPLHDIIWKRKVLDCDESINVSEFTITLEPYEIKWLKSSE